MKDLQRRLHNANFFDYTGLRLRLAGALGPPPAHQQQNALPPHRSRSAYSCVTNLVSRGHSGGYGPKKPAKTQKSGKVNRLGLNTATSRGKAFKQFFCSLFFAKTEMQLIRTLLALSLTAALAACGGGGRTIALPQITRPQPI